MLSLKSSPWWRVLLRFHTSFPIQALWQPWFKWGHLEASHAQSSENRGESSFQLQHMSVGWRSCFNRHLLSPSVEAYKTIPHCICESFCCIAISGSHIAPLTFWIESRYSLQVWWQWWFAGSKWLFLTFLIIKCRLSLSLSSLHRSGQCSGGSQWVLTDCHCVNI